MNETSPSLDPDPSEIIPAQSRRARFAGMLHAFANRSDSGADGLPAPRSEAPDVNTLPLEIQQAAFLGEIAGQGC